MMLSLSSKAPRATTSSGAFFSASLDELGNNIAPGAMLPTATIDLSSSRKSTVKGNVANSNPKSPVKDTENSARSGSIVIWGTGWDEYCDHQPSVGSSAVQRICPSVHLEEETFLLPQIDREFEGALQFAEERIRA